MTIISTEEHSASQAQSSHPRAWNERTVGATLLLTSAVATIGWLFALAEGAMAVADWLIF